MCSIESVICLLLPIININFVGLRFCTAHKNDSDILSSNWHKSKQNAQFYFISSIKKYFILSYYYIDPHHIIIEHDFKTFDLQHRFFITYLKSAS